MKISSGLALLLSVCSSNLKFVSNKNKNQFEIHLYQNFNMHVGGCSSLSLAFHRVKQTRKKKSYSITYLDKV